MGLDMYMYRKLYVKNWELEKEDRYEVTVTRNGKVLEDWSNPTYIEKEVGYWRKFNALHGYIVDEFAGGLDNCEQIYLSKEDLQKILDTLIEVYETKDATKLPPTEGFFFGSTDVDEYYWDDVKQSIEAFKTYAADDEWVDYFYTASW